MKDSTAVGLGVGAVGIYIVVIVAGLIGWVMNIVTIAQSDFVMTGMLIVRIVGILIAPLGAVLGYL